MVKHTAIGSGTRNPTYWALAAPIRAGQPGPFRHGRSQWRSI